MSAIKENTIKDNSATEIKVEKKVKKEKKKKKSKTIRCNHPDCRKKLTFEVNRPCRCGKVFCSKHFLFSNHGCNINYFQANKDVLSKNMGGGNFQKINSI
tara:strand:- start:885 stop:1184 length:300 start_codon:yes stop_codon:yes gene_type:complete